MNIFPYPSMVNKEKNEIVKEVIVKKFSESGGLQFHYMMEQFESAIEKKDKDLATIIAYYTTNVILSHEKFTKDDRARLIGGMRELLSDL